MNYIFSNSDYNFSISETKLKQYTLLLEKSVQISTDRVEDQITKITLNDSYFYYLAISGISKIINNNSEEKETVKIKLDITEIYAIRYLIQNKQNINHPFNSEILTQIIKSYNPELKVKLLKNYKENTESESKKNIDSESKKYTDSESKKNIDSESKKNIDSEKFDNKKGFWNKIF
jgi:hypothetical protein